MWTFGKLQALIWIESLQGKKNHLNMDCLNVQFSPKFVVVFTLVTLVYPSKLIGLDVTRVDVSSINTEGTRTK